MLCLLNQSPRDTESADHALKSLGTGAKINPPFPRLFPGYLIKANWPGEMTQVDKHENLSLDALNTPKLGSAHTSVIPTLLWWDGRPRLESPQKFTRQLARSPQQQTTRDPVTGKMEAKTSTRGCSLTSTCVWHMCTLTHQLERARMCARIRTKIKEQQPK